MPFDKIKIVLKFCCKVELLMKHLFIFVKYNKILLNKIKVLDFNLILLYYISTKL